MERIPEEIIETYEKSDAYQALLYKKRELYGQLIKYHQKYQTMKEYFKKEVEERADHESYAKGGEGLHRGILCPGNIEALIIGKVTRGRTAKEKEKANYIYRYDKDNQLVCCIRVGEAPYVPDLPEYIFWEEDRIQIGLTYDQFGELDYIAEARYNEDGRLMSYIYSGFSNKKPFSITSEQYEYQDRKCLVTFLYAVGQYVEGVHIVLYTDEEGTVLRYTRCTDMNQDEVYEEIPKYKLVI